MHMAFSVREAQASRNHRMRMSAVQCGREGNEGVELGADGFDYPYK